MNSKNQNRFIFSVAVILFIMAASQLFTTLKIPSLLEQSDTLLGLSLRNTFYLIAGIELAFSAYLLAGKNIKLKCGMIAWLILNLSLYQIGLSWSHLPNYLVCLGNINPDFQIPPRTLNWIVQPLLGYGLLGSCAFLIHDWLSNRKLISKNHAITPKTGEQIQTA